MQRKFWDQYLKAENDLERIKLIETLPMFHLNKLAYMTPSLFNAYLRDLISHLRDDKDA